MQYWGPNPKVTQAFSPGCPQNCELPPKTCPDTVSEDCLYLNVFTPREDYLQSNGPQPVMVWFHGGRYEQGSASDILYDGSFMANASGVIIVTANYRIGVLGFLVTGSLQGNYGWQDQRSVLLWVQNNIANFGGDPNSVTVFGQSVGGISTALHLTSPSSVGLLHKAIIQSDPFTLPVK